MGEENQKLADELGVTKFQRCFIFKKSGKFIHKFVEMLPKKS